MTACVVAMMTIRDAATCPRHTDRPPPSVEYQGGCLLTPGELVPHTGRMVIPELSTRLHADGWLADPECEEAVAFRHGASTLHRPMVQEVGSNTADPDPEGLT